MAHAQHVIVELGGMVRLYIDGNMFNDEICLGLEMGALFKYIFH